MLNANHAGNETSPLICSDGYEDVEKGKLTGCAGTETGTVIMTNSTEGIKTESYLISPLSHVCERSNEDQKR